MPPRLREFARRGFDRLAFLAVVTLGPGMWSIGMPRGRSVIRIYTCVLRVLPRGDCYKDPIRPQAELIRISQNG